MNQQEAIQRLIDRAEGIANHAAELDSSAEKLADTLFGEPKDVPEAPKDCLAGRIEAELDRCDRCDRNLFELRHRLERIAREV